MTSGFNEIQLEENGNKIVTLIFREKLTKDDYELFVPQLENLMEKEDTIRILVEFQDFQGWTLGALWEDTKFGTKHFNDIDRLAIVGDRQWEKFLASFIKPFTTATVRYFDSLEKEAAKQWLKEERAK
ncbi:MAG: STAS/SEC14 domain-containing protein [Deltaproteobacteria bacterium]|nr:STAS/SEC14 domain-containing protein [Deltaproteobacteria bacterium]